MSACMPVSDLTICKDFESESFPSGQEKIGCQQTHFIKFRGNNYQTKLGIFGHKCYLLCLLICALVFELPGKLGGGFIPVHTELSYLFTYLLTGHVACEILVLQPGIKPGPLAVRVWSSNHWTAREVSDLSDLEVALGCLIVKKSDSGASSSIQSPALVLINHVTLGMSVSLCNSYDFIC